MDANPLILPDTPFAFPTNGKLTDLTNISAIYYLPENVSTPYMQQWNFGLGFQFGKDYGLEVNYVGSKGTRLFGPSQLYNGIDMAQYSSQFIAGVMAHSAALTALVAPTINSYKRLRLGASLSGTTWSPPYLAQGPNNRTAALRTLHGRFEWRVPDSSTNPYLATAALIVAGLDGIDRKLEPPAECIDDLFELSPAQVRARGIPLLPQSLTEALDALAADELICSALGATLAEEFLRLKRAEVTEYQQQVSDWEMQRYAEAF